MPVLEVIATDIPDFSQFAYTASNDLNQPVCRELCVWAASRNYNSWVLETSVQANSVVRVWLVQVAETTETCFSFKLAAKIAPPEE